MREDVFNLALHGGQRREQRRKADDIDWVEARSDPDAFATAVAIIYRQYVSRVYHYCYCRVSNIADAEDLTSQVFTDAIESLPKYQDRGNFAGWLFTIARRRVADHYRHREDHHTFDEAWDSDYGSVTQFGATSPDPMSEVISKESLTHLADLVNDLRERDRELLRLRFAAELTYKEIASILGRSKGAVKMATHRLLNRLASRWEDKDDN